MTRHYETREVTQKEEIFVSCTCDWCGKNITKRQLWGDSHDVVDISFGWSSYGEYMTVWAVDDLCHDCAIRLGDELSKLGIKLRKPD